MLDQCVATPASVERLRSGPFGPYLDSFASERLRQGYAKSTVRAYLPTITAFGSWLEGDARTVVELSDHVADEYLEERRRMGLLHRREPTVIRQLLEHLRAEGVVPVTHTKSDDSPLAEFMDKYEAHLREERGLTPATVVNYVPFAHRFLFEHFGEGRLHLRDLGSSEISSFILRHAGSMSPGRAKLMVTALRSLFRFLFLRGDVEIDMASSVPTVADWRLSTVPKYLHPEEVERLLDACDRGTPPGRRDYAILLLLARLGLRANEVVTLELDDIDWRAGEILVLGKGLVRDRLPLVPDVGEVLAEYVCRDRPRVSTRRLFIRAMAPLRGFAGPSSVSVLVARALKRAGLQPPITGAHLLRHSLATTMLRRGASMTEVGEVLRHRTTNSTEVYAKVDFVGLRSLAQPWPGEGGGR